MTDVLIMEDNVALGLEWRAALENSGFNVVLEPDGDRATKRLDTETFDLVITDLIVPKGRGGLSVIGKLLVMGDRAPASIVVTGADTSISGDGSKNHFLEQARRLGANLTLKKPISAEELVQTAQEILGAQPPGG